MSDNTQPASLIEQDPQSIYNLALASGMAIDIEYFSMHY